VVLGWKEPTDGGPVGAYNIQRRRRDGGEWLDVGTATATEIALDQQEPGIEYEYQVLAVNKAAEGRPSNVVRAVV
jgi:hypothetical protein